MLSGEDSGSEDDLRRSAGTDAAAPSRFEAGLGRFMRRTCLCAVESGEAVEPLESVRRSAWFRCRAGTSEGLRMAWAGRRSVQLWSDGPKNSSSWSENFSRKVLCAHAEHGPHNEFTPLIAKSKMPTKCHQDQKGKPRLPRASSQLIDI